MVSDCIFVISLILGNLTANRVKATDEWNDLATPVEQSASELPAVSAEPNGDVPASSVPAANSDVPAAEDAKAEEKDNESSIPQ